MASTPWHSRRVLVTGATGLVGARLVRLLLERSAHVVCFVRDGDPSSPLWLSGDIDRVAVAHGRLENPGEIKAAITEREIDTVFHLGAQAIVGVGRVDPIGTFESNIRGTWNLLEACRVYGPGIRRVVVASSDKAYGDCDELPYTESTALAARNPYDVSKSCTDLIAQSYAASYGVPIAIARCGNIFGPGDLNFSRLIPGTIRSLLSGEAPVLRSNGRLVREYLYVDDAAEAYLSLSDWLDRPASRDDTQRAFNFSTGEALTVLEMVRRIAMAVGREDLEPRILNNTVGEIADQRLDCTRARAVLHWRPQHDLDAALLTTVRWYRNHFAARDWSRTLSCGGLSLNEAPARASA